MTEQIIKVKCTYCGGYEFKKQVQEKDWKESLEETRLEISSEKPNLEDKIVLCADCAIKALDKVLGKRFDYIPWWKTFFMKTIMQID